MLKISASISLAAVLCGCGTFTPAQVAQPSDITIKSALSQVAEGVAEMQAELRDRKIRLGVIVDEVNVTFNVTANATRTDTLSVDLSNGPATNSVIAASLKGSDQLVATGTRGNVVNIKLKNIYTAGLNDFALGRSGASAKKDKKDDGKGAAAAKQTDGAQKQPDQPLPKDPPTFSLGWCLANPTAGDCPIYLQKRTER